jgi:hypothetical protein
MEGILTPVSGDAEFGQTEDIDPVRPRSVEGFDDPIAVAVPVQRCLIERGGGDVE